MSRNHQPIKTFLKRTALALFAVACVAATGMIMPLFISYFYHTSYRFVAIFLLLILLSNVLAKTARAYIEA